jgi:hypothetical protein
MNQTDTAIINLFSHWLAHICVGFTTNVHKSPIKNHHAIYSGSLKKNKKKPGPLRESEESHSLENYGSKNVLDLKYEDGVEHGSQSQHHA